MGFGGREDELHWQLVREIKETFQSRATDFVVLKAVHDPYLDIEIEFIAFQYFVIAVLVERDGVFFSLREGRYLIPLVKASLLAHGAFCAGALLRADVLVELESEIRVRIPDKYLVSKGW